MNAKLEEIYKKIDNIDKLKCFYEKRNDQYGIDCCNRDMEELEEEKKNLLRQFDSNIDNEVVHKEIKKPPLPKAKKAMPKNAKQKILFLAANPTNLSQLQTDKEYRIIKAELERGTHREQFEFLLPQLSLTIGELVRVMNNNPEIVHFSGHGNTAGIALVSDNNIAQLMPTSALERLFKPLKNTTKLVILNACYSAEQAKAISALGIYVIGNNLPIGDDAAISFAKGLYIGLSEGKPLEKAFNDAMIVLTTENPNYSDVVEVWKDGNKLDW